MLSRATYAGRICLSCRYQLRLTRPGPLPAKTRFPRFRMPWYSTTANDDAESRPKDSESKSGERPDQPGRDDPAPEPKAPEFSPGSVPSPRAKLAEPSADAAPTYQAGSFKPIVEVVPLPGSDPEGPTHQTRPTPAADIEEPEIDSFLAFEDEMALAEQQIPSQRPERGPRKQRGRNGVDIETTSLGMNILGKEGHTIVLRDRERRRQEPAPLEDETPSKNLDIEGSIEEQSRDITTEETRRNIDELRPGDSRDLLGREFDQILNTLMDGFTSSQLEDYVCHSMRRVEGKSGDMPEAQRKHLLKRLTGNLRAELRWPVRPRYGWIRQQLSWKPPKNYPWGNTMKEKLALAIMRACWHLQVMEETPYIGQVNVTVDPQILNLLPVESKSLRTIQSSLGEGAGIKLIPEKEMMQITASRSKCDVALDQLDRFVSRMEGATIPLSALGPGKLPEGILERLGSLTGTSLAYNGAKAAPPPSKNRKPPPTTPTQGNSDAIRIAWLKTASRPDTVESLPHVIFRLLLSANTPRNTTNMKATVKTILSKEAKVGPKSLVLVRHHGDNHELPWNLRDQAWSRLVYPLQPKLSQHKRNDTVVPEEFSTRERSADSSDVVDPPPERQGGPKSTTDVDTMSDPQPSPDSSQVGSMPLSALRLPVSGVHGTAAVEGWSPTLRRTSAVFGHVLHPFPTGGQHTTVAHQKLVSPDSVSLKPVLPPIAALTDLAANAGDAEEALTTTLLIRLWPKQGPAPPLEFHLEVPKKDGPLEWETTAKKLVAVRYSWAAHMRLPFLPVDVRIQQSLASEMDASAVASSAPLRSFFEKSKLDLSSDLLTPSSLTLPIPSTFAYNESKAGETDPAEYYFMGLELHTSSTVPFRTNRLTLTSIEAGQQGRRAELALHAADVKPSEARDGRRQFLDEVLRVAKGSYFPWVGSRPFDASSLEDSS